MNNTTQQTVQRVNKDGSPDKRFKVNRPPVITPVRTINGITYVITSGLNYRIMFREAGRDLGVVELNVYSSNISCGVRQVSGISRLEHFANRSVPTELIVSAMRECLTQIKRNTAGWLIMSNHAHSYCDSIMQEVCPTFTEHRRNPNSGRRISIFCY